jgi:hypothetical protein
LLELTNDLVISSDSERRDFARIVLVEMSAVYEEELNRARQFVPKTEAARRKLSRWRYATGSFLVQLLEIYQTLDSGASVGLHVDNHQRLLLIVERRPVVMSGPRIGREKALEERIVNNYCRIHECSQPREAERYIQPKPDFSDPGTWVLAQNHRPRYETGDGLSFRFRNIANRMTKEQACLAVVVELRELVAALMEARESGEQINWAVIKIESIPVSDDHQVILNERGDYLRLELHTLGKSGELWREFLPWVRSQTSGEKYHMNFLNAERLVSPVATHP